MKRLIANDFIFYTQRKNQGNNGAIKQENCNIAEFMNDAQAVQLLPDYTTSSVDIYNAYVNWCHGNGLQELKQKSFYDWLYHNCETYNLVPTNKAYNGRNYVKRLCGNPCFIQKSYRVKKLSPSEKVCTYIPDYTNFSLSGYVCTQRFELE